MGASSVCSFSNYRITRVSFWPHVSVGQMFLLHLSLILPTPLSISLTLAHSPSPEGLTLSHHFYPFSLLSLIILCTDLFFPFKIWMCLSVFHLKTILPQPQLPFWLQSCLLPLLSHQIAWKAVPTSLLSITPPALIFSLYHYPSLKLFLKVTTNLHTSKSSKLFFFCLYFVWCLKHLPSVDCSPCLQTLSPCHQWFCSYL